jgi:hypothetical protein
VKFCLIHNTSSIILTYDIGCTKPAWYGVPWPENRRTAEPQNQPWHPKRFSGVLY